MEVIAPDQIRNVLQDRADAAVRRFDANPSQRNTGRMEAALADLEHARRDVEYLVRGVVPSEYVTVSVPGS